MINQYEIIHQKNCRAEMNGQDEKVADFWHDTLLPFAHNNNLIEDPEIVFESRLPAEFHQIFWEFYVAYRLFLSGIKVMRPPNKNAPDFFFLHKNEKVWIECVCANVGDVPKLPMGVSNYPSEKIKLRISSSLSSKVEKIKEEYKERGIIDKGDKYIIAINTAQALNGRKSSHGAGVCLTTAVLLNIGHLMVSFSQKSTTETDLELEHCPKVLNKNGSNVEFNFFDDKNLIGVISFDAFLWNTIINKGVYDFNYIINPDCYYDVFCYDPFDNVTSKSKDGYKLKKLKFRQIK